ncbi:hypothetical protein EFV37_14060 [Mesorhizobium loti]|uniref:Uncharacterized protein n=1 Tax=Mesorhizobium jarvisii TaxID=1777867 RepID=A0A6M7TET9_9HYPH|nr:MULTISPECIES: hypothetical protein [Mesorhizobium]OBQ58190.1 hypothetical protein A9K72_28800 [Mesorhizobium loti]QKC63305.1 hypothetical protein EB229_14055 [Mesorhizobium jarvisii]QKD09215.1 hypothetical protein EFV37_14060 [Mesorhizobium loti]RJT30311.1 hypothetical protein D3242_26785 [Mesorhizobium jarvisii]BCH03891.1 hypothetical protein MesoLj131b_58900 [Mesorhizobium sp. 131-2-5]
MTLLRRHMLVLLLIAGAMFANIYMLGGRESSASQTSATPPVKNLPDYLGEATDPWSGTTFVRITQPGILGLAGVCGKKYCTHRYSSAQAWNADQSLLVIVNGCGGMCFLDGHSYVPLFHRDRSNETECEWHPRDPQLMICVAGRQIYTWAPRTNHEDVVFDTAAYSKLQFGPYKGNPSRDGNRIAVRATRNDGKSVVFGYDLKQRRKFPDIDLTQLPGTTGSCSISPLGINIVCSQALSEDHEPTFVFSIDGVLQQKWMEHHRPGHGDMTVDADGSEIYVGISKSNPDIYQVIKRRLADGKVTSLMKYGEAMHASLRSLDRPGWVFLSYGGTPAEVSQHPDWAPYAQQVIAVRTDGSGEVRRIVETQNTHFDYWSETHASPSPDGSQVIWSSNWGVPGGPVYDFVTRLEWPSEPVPNQKEIVANGLQ